jgi:hypothetical protein
LTAKQKKEYAWLLFREGTLTQKAIAQKAGVSEKTISSWKDTEQWESKRRSLYNTREDILVDMYLIFENTKNQIKDKGGIANSKDGDAILKLSQAIKNLETETSVGQIFEVCKGLIQYVQKVDFEKAKEIINCVADSKKQIEIQWDEFRDSIKASTPVDLRETIEQRKLRIKKLETDAELWFKYYFPKYSYAEPAPFHLKATQRIINNLEWYEVRSWSRELAKSTRTMFEMLYLVLTGKKKYILLVSTSKENADVLLEPYRVQLDSNQRLINDYGFQERTGKWTQGDFTTKKGVKFKAIGAGQSPRGTRNEEVRPDAILFDDMDTDEDCRNNEIIKKRWAWIEDSAIGTRSISKKTLILFCGNIIAKDCCVVRAQQYADHVDVINIRDENNKSSWDKNSEQDVDRVLSQKSYSSQQKEYFNNPITEGGIFAQMYYKPLRSITDYKFLVNYIDLSYKDGKKNDFKFSVLMGKYKDEYHILKTYGIQGTTAKFCEGMVEIEKWIDNKVPVFWVSEEVFLLDIIRKEIQGILSSLKSKIIITPDTRDKGDKLTRIEAALEPLNRNGKLWLNQREADSPSMKILEGQFIALEYGNKRSHDDGPDATEGAKYIIDSKDFGESSKVITGKKLYNKNRY